MRYTLAVAALIGLLTFDQVHQVKANELEINDEEQENKLENTNKEEGEEGQQNDQDEQSEDKDDEDDEGEQEDLQIKREDEEEEDNEKTADENDGDEDTLIYEGSRMDENEDDPDNQEPDEEADEDVQIDNSEELQEGKFEMLDDSIVHEDQAVEMEQLNFEIKPHSVMTVGLEDEDDEDKEADDEGEEGNEEGDEEGADHKEEEGEKESKPEDSNNLQLEDEFFTPEMDGHAGLGEKVYERVVPARFTDGGDTFMQSMIKNYALEGKNEDGTPNGKFFMSESITKNASLEVLKTHKKLAGKEAEEYMKQYFARTWAHFDVTHDGNLDVDVMPQFMRFLASDQALELS